MREVPVLAMLSLPVEALRARADRLRRTLGASVTVETTDASVGGGAFPGATVPSVALSLPGATTLEQHLRLGEPAVIGRLAGERLLLDLRTVLHEEDEALASAVRAALAS